METIFFCSGREEMNERAILSLRCVQAAEVRIGEMHGFCP